MNEQVYAWRKSTAARVFFRALCLFCVVALSISSCSQKTGNTLVSSVSLLFRLWVTWQLVVIYFQDVIECIVWTKSLTCTFMQVVIVGKNFSTLLPTGVPVALQTLHALYHGSCYSEAAPNIECSGTVFWGKRRSCNRSLLKLCFHFFLHQLFLQEMVTVFLCKAS